jgi:AMMECR1 domain-containing protein
VKHSRKVAAIAGVILKRFPELTTVEAIDVACQVLNALERLSSNSRSLGAKDEKDE